MSQVVLNGRTYDVTDCTRCNGTGRFYDITCADKINAGPNAHQCSRCRGRSTVYTYVPTAEQLAYRENTERAVRDAIGVDTSPENVAEVLALFGD